jgi:hypothetical protein
VLYDVACLVGVLCVSMRTSTIVSSPRLKPPNLDPKPKLGRYLSVGEIIDASVVSGPGGSIFKERRTRSRCTTRYKLDTIHNTLTQYTIHNIIHYELLTMHQTIHNTLCTKPLKDRGDVTTVALDATEIVGNGTERT